MEYFKTLYTETEVVELCKPYQFLIICLDEEELIGKCLYWLFENIKPDEYIIVDGGSEDDTIKIINKFTVNNQVNLKLFKKSYA